MISSASLPSASSSLVGALLLLGELQSELGQFEQCDDKSKVDETAPSDEKEGGEKAKTDPSQPSSSPSSLLTAPELRDRLDHVSQLLTREQVAKRRQEELLEQQRIQIMTLKHQQHQHQQQQQMQQQLHQQQQLEQQMELQKLQQQLAAIQKTESAAPAAASSTCSIPCSPSFSSIPVAPPLTKEELSTLSLDYFPELHPLISPPAAAPISEKHLYLAASIYLYDSFHFRSFLHDPSYAALISYKFARMSRWKSFVRWISWIHIFLSFVEPPTSLTYDGCPIGLNHIEAGGVELFCLSIYAFHAYKQYCGYGPGRKGYWRSSWRCIKIFILALSLLDVVISMARNKPIEESVVHLSQLLRVFFVVEQSGRMRTLCSSIIRSLPSILSIMFLCSIHICLFSIIGFFLIGPFETASTISPNLEFFFHSIGDSLNSCLILLTSGNFPSVMLPAYRRHWLTCIFFIVFLLIGHFVLLQLTIAVVFHFFQRNSKAALKKSVHRRKRALQATFTLLSENTCGCGKIELSTWKKLIAQRRPDWSEEQAEVLWRAATANHQAPTNNEQTDGHQQQTNGEFMTYIQFEQIIGFTQSSFKFDKKADSSNYLSYAHPFWPTFDSAGDAAGVLDDDLISNDISSISMVNMLQHLNDHSAAASRSQSHADLNHADGGIESEHDGPILLEDGDHERLQTPFAPLDSSEPSPSLSLVTSFASCISNFAFHFRRLMMSYFTYRVPFPSFVMYLLGRSEDSIRRAEVADLPLNQPSTPIHPPISIRTHLTTFSLNECVTDMLVILHAILIFSRIAGGVNGDSTGATASRTSSMMIEILFLFEVLTKWYLCGRKFFNSNLHVLDLLTTIIMWIVQIILMTTNLANGQDGVRSIRLLRGFRLYHRIESFTLLLQVVTQVGPALIGLVGVLFMMLYLFSIIGMMVFSKALVLGKVPTNIPYHSGDFYALNFNDLKNSLVLLFHQLVVNDWYLTMNATAEVVGHSARMFFIAFYAFATLTCISVCGAFVVDSYLAMKSKTITDKDGKKEKKAQSEKKQQQQPLPPLQLTYQPPTLEHDTMHNTISGSMQSNHLSVMSTSFPSPVLSSSDDFFRSPYVDPSEIDSEEFQQIAKRLHADLTAQSKSVGPPNPLSSHSPSSFASSSFALDSTNSTDVSSRPPESTLLARIRSRASALGLGVNYRPKTGMNSSLMAVYQEEEEEN